MRSRNRRSTTATPKQPQPPFNELDPLAGMPGHEYAQALRRAAEHVAAALRTLDEIGKPNYAHELLMQELQAPLSDAYNTLWTAAGDGLLGDQGRPDSPEEKAEADADRAAREAELEPADR